MLPLLSCTFEFHLAFATMAFACSVQTPGCCFCSVTCLTTHKWLMLGSFGLCSGLISEDLHAQPDQRLTDHFHCNEDALLLLVPVCGCAALGFTVIRVSHCSHGLPQQRHVPACSHSASGLDHPKPVEQAPPTRRCSIT